MTDEEMDELALLKLANETGKFAIQIGLTKHQLALERLQVRRWVSLIDVTPIAERPGMLFRIFLASPAAMAWRTRATMN
jgi:hypothetical protein